ncbi:pseudouridine synthase [Agaribacillus aureus]
MRKNSHRPGSKSRFKPKNEDNSGLSQRSASAKRPGGARKEKKFDRSKQKSGPPDYNQKTLKSRISKSAATAKDNTEESIRLNKYIANAGVCSRRDADKLISAGEISVNGKIISELGYKVKATDTIKYKNKLLTREKFVYVLLNKPKDFITTTDDPNDRRTVMQLVSKACKERIYPVGRLDRNTTGLLLFTNDGDLAKKLSHPSHNTKKVYQVELDKPLHKDDFLKVSEGLELEDGLVKVDDFAILSDDKKSLGLEIHLGKNRIVRRIFEHLGYEVIKLDRVVYGGLTKKDLKRGTWRYLSEREVVKLKHLK